MQLTRERRKILIAIAASLILHLVVAVSLASFGDKLQPSMPAEEKPTELTLVDLPPPTPPPLVQKNAPFIDTPANRETKEEPEKRTFESNANSVAASQLPAAEEAPIPTQDGKERPGLDLANERYSLALQGNQPRPEAQNPTTPQPRPTPAHSSQPNSTPSAVPSATPQVEPSAEPEQLAMLRPTPPQINVPPAPSATPEMSTPPEVRPKATPQTPSSAYRREQMPTRVTGNISNRGIASVNAVGTPLGRYQKLIDDAVGSRWYSLVRNRLDQVNIGNVRIEFVVDRAGHVTKMRIVQNTSSESFVNLCLESVQEIKLPPIPEEVAATLPAEGLPADMSFTIYPNR